MFVRYRIRMFSLLLKCVPFTHTQVDVDSFARAFYEMKIWLTLTRLWPPITHSIKWPPTLQRCFQFQFFGCFRWDAIKSFSCFFPSRCSRQCRLRLPDSIERRKLQWKILSNSMQHSTIKWCVFSIRKRSRRMSNHFRFNHLEWNFSITSAYIQPECHQNVEQWKIEMPKPIPKWKLLSKHRLNGAIQCHVLSKYRFVWTGLTRETETETESIDQPTHRTGQKQQIIHTFHKFISGNLICGKAIASLE